MSTLHQDPTTVKLHKMLTTTARQLAHCLKFANGNIKGLNLQEVVPKCKIARTGTIEFFLDALSLEIYQLNLRMRS